MHQYLDSDGSGTSDQCVSSTIGGERLQNATAWRQANDLKGFLDAVLDTGEPSHHVPAFVDIDEVTSRRGVDARFGPDRETVQYRACIGEVHHKLCRGI